VRDTRHHPLPNSTRSWERWTVVAKNVAVDVGMDVYVRVNVSVVDMRLGARGRGRGRVRRGHGRLCLCCRGRDCTVDGYGNWQNLKMAGTANSKNGVPICTIFPWVSRGQRASSFALCVAGWCRLTKLREDFSPAWRDGAAPVKGSRRRRPRLVVKAAVRACEHEAACVQLSVNLPRLCSRVEYAMSSLAVKNAWRALGLSDPPR
jgi:hypothetical protein